MKKLLLAAAVALPMTSPALFANDTGLMNISENISAVEMTSEDLGAVKGRAFAICISCLASNTATVTQANLSVLSLGVLQGNSSYVDQSNN